MWLYLLYFLLYTIINPTVPFAWLHFGYSVYPVHDGVCMCVYVCLHTKEAVFFLPSADLWACLGAGVCLCMCVCVLTLGFPEHCDSSGMCTWVEETKTFCPDCSISFDHFARLTRTRSGMLVVEKSGTKKKLVLLWITQCLTLSLSFGIFVCLCESFVNVWSYARFSI